MPNSTPFLNTKEEIKSVLISALPGGYLYRNNDGVNQILDGFTNYLYDISEEIRQVVEDFYYIDNDNQFLDRFLAQYSLPNVIFPNIENADQAVLAIAGMKVARDLVSKEDYENFLLTLGVNIRLYHYQNELLEHCLYPYVYPKIYGGVAPKKKITWLVYIVENSDSQANYGVPYPRYYYNSSAGLLYAKNVLDYLKPDYIIFQYINAEIKALYGI